MYPSSAIASSTRERVSGLTLGLLLITRDTVIAETPASRATSLIVTGAADMGCYQYHRQPLNLHK
jgi:hypothetical protein